MLFLAIGLAAACQKDVIEEEDDQQNQEPPVEEQVPVISNIVNSYADKDVSYHGSTISVKFDATASWTASLELLDAPEKEWARIGSTTMSGTAKKSATVRIIFDANKTYETRTAELWVTAEGCEPQCIAVLTQAAAGTSADAKINAALNTYMHEILL